ncbi:MFS transporter [Candidatus Bathyarchaeota archaeon]|nr:MFS transporter [Candidatus Bathyarchaeota archaeon]
MKLKGKEAYVSIFLLGIVSLMGDIVYEGARGVIPDYLKFLGVSAFIVGFIAGFGEFLGYAVRLISGVLADATRAYWFFMFLGYGLIFSIPALGFTNAWKIVVALVLIERLGKAFRSPSRDTILSIVSKGVGAGKAFGFHEFLDQIGAVSGPIIVSALMFYSHNNYSLTFSFLLLPFLALLTALIYAYKNVKTLTFTELKTFINKENVKLEKSFHIYTLAVVLNTVGLIPASLILYKASIIVQPMNKQWVTPLIYLLIQGVDASIALLAGYSYDRFGVKTLILPFILSFFPSTLTMVNFGLNSIIVAAIFFGVVLGMQESIYRAAVSGFAPISARGKAYGIFNTAYGIGFILSGTIYGLMIDLNAPFTLIVMFAGLMQALATIILLKIH